MNVLAVRLALLAGCLLLTAPVRAENWPQWRGPNNDGISAEKNLPTTWGADKNIAWKLELPGISSSTPAIWGEHIFLTVEADKKVLLLCIGTDGKQKWKRDLGSDVGKGIRKWGNRDEGNMASPSPVTDGKNVYVFAGHGEFAAFDFDGKEQWRFNAQKRYGEFSTWWGFHTTPALYKDRLYLQLLHDNAAALVCLNTKDGKEVWKVDRESDGTDENKHSYASVMVWSNGKEAYLVSHGNDYTTAHSLEDGKEIWRLGDLNPREKYDRFLRFVASPVCTPDLIVVPTAKRKGIVAVKPEAKGRVEVGGKYEQWRKTSGTPDVPSPLVHDGVVYLCDEGGSSRPGAGLTCLDAKSGDQLYVLKIHNRIHRASPVYADSKIYLLARDGTATVTQAGKEGKVLATNKLPDQTAASPAVSSGRIYIRGYKYLWAIEEKK